MRDAIVEGAMTHEDIFVELRPLLFTIAYEILGSATDADDVLQEAYLRWRVVDASAVQSPRSYLARTVTRQALNHLRTVKRRRETYVGNWLPEPILTGSDVGSDAVLAEGLSMAMLVVLESLTPEQRVVFVLQDVFGFRSAEIATMIDKSDAAVRQLVRRARESVQERRPRFEAEPADVDALLTRFAQAARGGDIQALMDLLAPNVVQVSDGGGKVVAARRPIVGTEQVARFVIGVARTAAADSRIEFAECNAMPAVLLWSGELLDSVLLFSVADGRIQRLFVIRNPDKLQAVSRVVSVSR